MHLAVLGVNHKTAPVELREKVSLNAEKCKQISERLLDETVITEVVPVSTCNRTEIYVVSPRPEVGRKEVITGLAQVAGIELRDLEKCVYFHEGEKTVDHLYRVVTSLDSMVVGEAQILGQIKEAYHSAHRQETTSIMLNRLFRHALEVGKRVRTDTRIGENPVSISSVAVEMVKKVYDDLDGRTALLLGAGKMSELTATHLVSSGITNVIVSNRTFSRAQEMAEKFDGQPVAFNDLPDYLPLSDVVVCSTGAPHYVIRKGEVERALRQRHNKPIFFIDIAVPRDIDPGVNDVYNAFLYDIDDLNDVADANTAQREKEARKAEKIITQEVGSFSQWVSSLDAIPTITALREKAEGIKDGELEKVLKKLDNLSEKDINRVEVMATAIVNKILHAPTVELKKAANERGGYMYVESIRRLFGLNGTRKEKRHRDEHRSDD